MIVEQKSSIKGEVKVPGDRSITHRALLIGGLARGTTTIEGAGLNEDTMTTIECLRKLGIGVEMVGDNKIKVYGKGLRGLNEPKTPINIENSGTTFRALLGILSGQQFNSTLVAEERGYKRSMKRIADCLKEMGADIESKDEEVYAPITINGSRLEGKDFKIKGSGGRLKSALIFASLFAEGTTKITESIPSRDHTERMLSYFGADIKQKGKTVTCSETAELYAKNIFVPGDTSYAVYFILAGLLIPGSEIVVRDVCVTPSRRNIIDILLEMGAKLEIENERTLNNEIVADIRAKYSKLKAIDVPKEKLDGFVEEIPAIMIAMTQAKGTSSIRVEQQVLAKENNRIYHMSAELAKMGAKINRIDDGVEIEGNKKLHGTIIETYNDERIAMPMGVAGIIAEGETMIKKVQCVDVAFADYFDILCDL